MTTLEFKWSTSRAEETYGYKICSLYADGHKVAQCYGGGYDMKGTCLGDFIAKKYADRLRSLKPEDMPEESHFEPADPQRRYCSACINAHVASGKAEHRMETPFTFDLTCPIHGEKTGADYNDGKRIDDGRYFYGLTFHNPNFDPGKAVITKKPAFGDESDAGKTVEQLESEGKSLGLDRYQQCFKASNKTPTARHTVPLIDGGCGFSSVEKIMLNIGLSLEYLPTRSNKKAELYKLHENRNARSTATTVPPLRAGRN